MPMSFAENWTALTSDFELMDDRERILEFLAKTPGVAGDIARGIGLRQDQVATLLMNMEKQKLIVWDRVAWRVPESPEAGEQGSSL